MERITRAARALGIKLPQGSQRSVRISTAVAILVASIMLPAGPAVAAGTLTNASVSLSDPRPSQTAVTQTFTGSSVDGAATVRCVRLIWATTVSGDTAPTGFDGTGGSVTAGSSTLINSSGTGWSLATSDGTSSTGQDNIWQYTNATGVVPGTTTGATFIAAGLTNPSTVDTGYYLRLNTYSNTNCSSGAIDNATVQFINTNGSTLSLTIDPSLSFTVNPVASAQSCNGTTTTQASTATTIPFGNVTSASNGVVCQDLTAATNATNGYTIFARYTGTPNNGIGDDIDNHSGTNASPTTFSSPGTEAYGYTTNDSTLAGSNPTANRFTSPSQGWAAMETTNREIAFQPAAAASTTFRIGHQVGISLTTAAGIYSTTIIYTCTPIY